VLKIIGAAFNPKPPMYPPIEEKRVKEVSARSKDIPTGAELNGEK